MTAYRYRWTLLAPLLLFAVCGAAPGRFGNVDARRLAQADLEPAQWFTTGRDGNGSFYSPLAQINDHDVDRLGFAWEYRTGTDRGLEATPVVVDGVVYVSGNWGVVTALDARSGTALWRFDPHNDGQSGRFACCDVVNRGVAVWHGRVYVASLDGRLFALDARSGRPVWSADTITDHRLPYTITGAPQIAGDLVVIGNGGADMGRGGVRGYVSAYDVTSGKLAWRFYTVPEPGAAQQAPDLLLAEKSWDPARSRQYGGGGTVWDGMGYDPALDLLYIGVGNASPYQRYDRSPRGGDNLFLSSIVALHAKTGRLAWFYQTTPGDRWDYTATQKLILADLQIGGHLRHVIMQAPKNGFFYVLDRATGEVISAHPYTYINWADGLDKHMRPIVSGNADYTTTPKLIFPSWGGGHDWQPMSFSPKTGLVYIPVLESPMIAIDLQHNPGAAVTHIDGAFGSALVIPDKDFNAADLQPLYGKIPTFAPLAPGTRKPLVSAVLKAWDPVAQKMVWQQKLSADYFVFDGGVMSTAGNLVFEGLADGEFRISAADSGKILKSFDTGSGIMAAPATYEVDGVQYVAVLAGYGGATIGTPFPSNAAPARYLNTGRLLVFRLGGSPAVPKPALRVNTPFRAPPPGPTTPAQVLAGTKLFAVYCARCHQFGTGLVPDLRRLDDGIESLAVFDSIVRGGALVAAGMGKFDDVLSSKDAEAIHDYLIDQAGQAYRGNRRGPDGAAAFG